MKRSATPQIITEFGAPPQPVRPPAAGKEGTGTPAADSPADATIATPDDPAAGSGAAGTSGKRRTPKT